MRIKLLRASRPWTVAQVAERFLLTEMTIMNWMRRFDEGNEASLVRFEKPSLDHFRSGKAFILV